MDEVQVLHEGRTIVYELIPRSGARRRDIGRLIDELNQIEGVDNASRDFGMFMVLIRLKAAGYSARVATTDQIVKTFESNGFRLREQGVA